ncbi:methylmalonyl-CoA mutase [Rhodoligotrophos appendicifer]|uniref:methylmalonyl-CoA mutase family protein n=1 Tax=Rhodoligotrophos appendicifer TaxID=987056 RepID=UPI00147933EF|nr:methylmalonyl-CoA mutase family protein [Rhodoligotrophos appendicifer]
MTSSFGQDGFPLPTREDWLKRVDATLKGADYKKRLVSRTDDGIEIDPLGGDWITVAPEWPGLAPFTRGAAAQAPAAQAPEAHAPEAHAPEAPGWRVGQTILEAAPARANAGLRTGLASGVSAVCLKIAEGPGHAGIEIGTVDDLDEALAEVFLEAVPVHLEAGMRGVEAAQMLVALWERREIAKAERSGSLGIDPLGILARDGAGPGMDATVRQAVDLCHHALECGDVQALVADTRGIHGAGATEAQELAAALATGVASLRALEKQGFDVATAARLIRFTLTADADVLTSIAKLRAARRLWARVTQACGIDPVAMRMTVETAARMMTARDPWVNMLRGTAASFAAAVGGAELIIVTPFTAQLGLPDDFATRIARNTQLMLQEESGLGRVADPAGGAWSVESLTEGLAEAGWAAFQEIEREGGMEAALRTGSLRQRITEAADARAKDYAKRKRLVTGVSGFPKLDEAPARTAGPLPTLQARGEGALKPRPLAEDFEALREASDRRLAESGARPAIFLATLGRLAEFNTRATWVRNLFEAGGLEAKSGPGYGSAEEAAEGFAESGAEIAILCSTDQVYERLAEPTARALKQAGAKWVAIAGRESAQAAAWRQAGVDCFAHEGGDVLAILRQAHDMLKMQDEQA